MVKIGNRGVFPKIRYLPSGDVKIDLLGEYDDLDARGNIYDLRLYSRLIECINIKYDIDIKIKSKFSNMLDTPEKRAELKKNIEDWLYSIEEDDKYIISNRLDFIKDVNKEISFEDFKYLMNKYKYFS